MSSKSSSSSDPFLSQSDISVASGTSAWVSSCSNGSTSETSEIQSDLHVRDNYSEADKRNLILENNSASLAEGTVNEAFSENNDVTLYKNFSEGKAEKHVQKPFNGKSNSDQENSTIVSQDRALFREIPQKYTPNEISTSGDADQNKDTSSKFSESVATSEGTDTLDISKLQTLPDTKVVLPLEEQQKMSRLLNNMQQRLVTSKADIEDLIARSNQELALRQYLTTKVCSVFHLSFLFLYLYSWFKSNSLSAQLMDEGASIRMACCI